jgi:tRNA(Ile)-lysidine synthase
MSVKMKVDLQPGKYVLAVSGGVDSMVLLDVLRLRQAIELVVAHFDHGIRPDSGEDEKLVAATAKSLALPYVTRQGKLGIGASEAVARKARYAFLEDVRQSHGARAIITAHHQDDLLETVIINLLRGTNRKGLSSLRSSDDLVRPLLGNTKAELRQYAAEHRLEWREDSTNENEQYLRNYVRKQLMTKLGSEQRAQLLAIGQQAARLNDVLDRQLASLLPEDVSTLERTSIIRLPHTAARELTATWLRANGLTNFDRKTLERLVVAAKTAQPGSQVPVIENWVIQLSKKHLALRCIER